MFTGIVRERGRILAAPEPTPGDGLRLVIGHSAELARELAIGASLAVSGVCLTVVELTAAAAGLPVRSLVELSPETLRRSTLGLLQEGSAVNLEPPLRAGDPLGGHLVQGHVDATAEVVGRRDGEGFRTLAIAVPAALSSYLIEKGSVTVDGVSLTVSALDLPAPPSEPGGAGGILQREPASHGPLAALPRYAPTSGDETAGAKGPGFPAPGQPIFEVALIPHTLDVTTLGDRVAGDRVNLEVDVIAKYVERMLTSRGLLAAASPAPAAGG